MVLTSSFSLIFYHFNASSIQLGDVNLFTISIARIALFCKFCSLIICGSEQHEYSIVDPNSKLGLIMVL